MHQHRECFKPLQADFLKGYVHQLLLSPLTKKELIETTKTKFLEYQLCIQLNLGKHKFCVWNKNEGKSRLAFFYTNIHATSAHTFFGVRITSQIRSNNFTWIIEMQKENQRLTSLGGCELIYETSDEGAPIKATGKFFTCVCHCDESWKNFTPVHSVPSM